ncbi:MAG: alpha/beta hydrolase [Pseudomonadota bacterium]
MTQTYKTDSGLHVIAAGPSDSASTPLLFIHGAGGNAAVWNWQAVHFARQRQVICVDLPGFGRSEPVTFEDGANHLARLIEEVLDAVGLDQAVIVAQSLGGWFALNTALHASNRVAGLVLSCTMAGTAHMPAIQAFAAAQAKMGEDGPAGLALSDRFQIENPLGAYLYRQITAFNPPLDMGQSTVFTDPQALVPPSKLAEIACPVLMVSGAEDPIWPPDSLSGLVPQFRHARQQVIPETGHSPYFETPEAFNSAVDAFLTEHAL